MIIEVIDHSSEMQAPNELMFSERSGHSNPYRGGSATRGSAVENPKPTGLKQRLRVASAMGKRKKNKINSLLTSRSESSLAGKNQKRSKSPNFNGFEVLNKESLGVSESDLLM